jgi:hypothetical protein
MNNNSSPSGSPGKRHSPISPLKLSRSGFAAPRHT